MTTFELSVTYNLLNKDLKPEVRSHRESKGLSLDAPWGYDFKRQKWTVDQLLTHVTGGHAWSVAYVKDGHRKSDEFISSQLIGVDLDRNAAIDELLNNDFVQRYAGLLYPSSSSKPENPKTRIVFVLDRPVTDPETYRRYVLTMIAKFADIGAEADEMCKDPARLFYGSTVATQGNSYVSDNVLPLEVIEALSQPVIEGASNGTHYEPPELNADSAYVEAALQGELGRLATASNGDRNNTLNKAAFNLGQFIQAGLLDRLYVEHLLEATALAIGLKQSEVVKSIKSGIDGGIAKPRDFSSVNTPPRTSYTNGTGRTSDSGVPTEDDGFLLGFSAADHGNALAVNALFPGQFLYCDAFGWMAYDGRCWDTRSAESLLGQAIIETLIRRRIVAVSRGGDKETYEPIVKATKASASNIRNCKTVFKDLFTVNPDAFDNDPDSLNCANGVVNLRTGAISPHCPEQRFTYCLPTSYDPTADSREWTAWLYETLKPETAVDDDKYMDLVKWLQAAIGYSLTGQTVEQVMFYLYGKDGRNGKGVFLQTLSKMLGRPLAAGVDVDTFTVSRGGDNQNFDLAPLKPARFVTASESEQAQMLNAKVIKGITGGDPIRCAFKHQTAFEYIPQYKVWLASNFKIRADADDEALWTRPRVIVFPNSYTGREDHLLARKLQSNMEGILAWAITGAIEWYRLFESGGRLGSPAIVTDATKDHRGDNDSVQMFLDEWAAMAADDPATYDAARIPAPAYRVWCEENNVNPFGARRLRPMMERRGYVYKNTKRNGVQQKSWVKA